MVSILTTIKKLLGIDESYEAFDGELIVHINTVFMILNQLGIGPSEGYSIIDSQDNWEDFTEATNLEAVKTYIYLRVRLLFDPPQNSFLVEAIRSSYQELEWRLLAQKEREEV